MNNQVNNAYNFNWNAYNPYSSSAAFSPVTAVPLSPMNNNYSYSSHYSSPSLSSGYGSENSFNNSPSISHYIPPFAYSIPTYNQHYSNSLNNQSIQLSTTKPTKRNRKDSEVEQENREPSSNNHIESSQQQSKRVNKKRKVDEQLVETNNDYLFDDQLDELDEENENDFSDLSQSVSNGEQNKKKRVLTKNQRIAANQRERKRMNIMNESFNELRQALPISTGRKRRKMSRLDIVCGAMEYIAYLDELLKSQGPYIINFEAYQNSMYFYD